MGINIRKKLREIPKQTHDTLEAFKNYWAQFTDKQKNLILASGLGIFGIIVWLQYGVFEFPLTNDMGIYLSGGKELLAGNVPYVAVFDVKPPMTFFASAISLSFFTNLLGLSPIFAIRIVMLLFGGGTVFFTYLFIYCLSNDRIHAIFSTIILLSFTGLGWTALSGRPKMLMVFFTIVCLYALVRKKWFIAGILGSLSALTWQPGAILPIVVILYALTDKQQRKTQFLRSALGAALPIVAVTLFFFVMGGLQELMSQTVLFTVVFKETVHWGFNTATNLLIYSIVYHYGTEILFFIAALLGFIFFTYGWRKTLINFKHPLLFFYLAFIPLALYSLYDFQGLWDLVPLLPFVSFFAAYFLLTLGKKIASFIQRKTKRPSHKIKTGVIASIIILSSLYGIVPILGEPQPVLKNIVDEISAKERGDQINQNIYNEGLIPAIPLIIEDVGIVRLITMLFFTTKRPDITSDEQMSMAAQVDVNSNPGERLLFIATPEILCLTHAKNFNRYILYPADILYMQGAGELTSFQEKVIAEQPSLIIVFKKEHVGDISTNISDFYIPQELTLLEFIADEYEIIMQTKNYGLLKNSVNLTFP